MIKKKNFWSFLHFFFGCQTRPPSRNDSVKTQCLTRSQTSKERDTRLVKTAGRAHGGLEGQAANVLPALLEKRDEVVDGKHDVRDELVVGHRHVTDGDTHAEDLLELELDGGLDGVDLVGKVLGVRDRGRELTGCEKESNELA